MSHNTYPKIGSIVTPVDQWQHYVVTAIHPERYDIAPVIEQGTTTDLVPITVGLDGLRWTNDWRPEVRTVLHQLELVGLHLVEIDNGADDDGIVEIKSGDKVTPEHIEEICACDECRIRVSDGKKRLGLYLVFGNSPGELVADYHVDPRIDQATDAASRIWDGEQVPRNYTS